MVGREGDTFEGLARLAIDVHDQLYALDTRRRTIQRFDRFHRRLPTWTIPGDQANPPVDIAALHHGLLVLLADGTIVYYNQDGVQERELPSAKTMQLGVRLDTATSIEVDHAGMVYICWSRNEAVTRYLPDGSFGGVRHPDMWLNCDMLADGQGRTLAIDEQRMVYVHDAQGWRLQSFPLGTRQGGVLQSPTYWSVSPDGMTLSVVDTRRYAIAIYDLSDLRVPPIVIGQRGRNNGQFEQPTGIAVDAAGRSYAFPIRKIIMSASFPSRVISYLNSVIMSEVATLKRLLILT